LAGETEVLGKNLPQCCFVHHKPHMLPSKGVGIEVNTEKTKYMLLSRHQIAGQNHDIKIASRCSENVVQFIYLEMTITNQTLIQEEIERRLNSVQNIMSSRLLSKNIKIRIYKTKILPVVL
jgi:hypothetical protein